MEFKWYFKHDLNMMFYSGAPPTGFSRRLDGIVAAGNTNRDGCCDSNEFNVISCKVS